MGIGRYIHKIIQSNYNAKILPIYFLDNYGGSADQLVIMKIYNENSNLQLTGPNLALIPKGGKLPKLRIRRLGSETR